MPFLSAIEIRNLAILAGSILALLALVELLHKRFGFAPEIARKSVHIGTGILIAFGPGLFTRALPIVLLSLVFILVNTAAYHFGVLRAVHHSQRRSFGTVYYPAALLGLALLFWESRPDIVVAAMLVLALGDGAAAAVGESIRRPREYRLGSDTKSLQGSAAMFLVSCGALAIAHMTSPAGLLPAASGQTLLLILFCISLAVFATVWEAISSRGLDNITVPFAVAAGLWIWGGSDASASAAQFIEATMFGLLTAAVSVRLRLLSPSGAAATYLLAVIVYGTGGWLWALPILAFFLLSSFLSRAGRTRKSGMDTLIEKTGARDMWQVAANGGIGGLLALAHVVFPDPRWYLAFLGSVAAATADTWGTEIGGLARGLPRNILTFRPSPRGSSGAVSVLGTLGGIAGAAVVSTLGTVMLGMDAVPWSLLAGLVAAGAFASIIDSVLGASVQARYTCTVCGSDTEKREHCGAKTTHSRGVAFMGNDAVNIVCVCAGAALGWIVASNFFMI
ncbi:MAG: DUF92 domain-containing protein [Ignavibacteriae bacterium]|nr:DUF92 domain-containing protein [Ignavibacteriota bacterium]